MVVFVPFQVRCRERMYPWRQGRGSGEKDVPLFTSAAPGWSRYISPMGPAGGRSNTPIGSARTCRAGSTSLRVCRGTWNRSTRGNAPATGSSRIMGARKPSGRHGRPADIPREVRDLFRSLGDQRSARERHGRRPPRGDLRWIDDDEREPGYGQGAPLVRRHLQCQRPADPRPQPQRLQPLQSPDGERYRSKPVDASLGTLV